MAHGRQVRGAPGTVYSGLPTRLQTCCPLLAESSVKKCRRRRSPRTSIEPLYAIDHLLKHLLSRRYLLRVQLGDDPTKDDVKAFTEKTLSSGKVLSLVSQPALAYDIAIWRTDSEVYLRCYLPSPCAVAADPPGLFASRAYCRLASESLPTLSARL